MNNSKEEINRSLISKDVLANFFTISNFKKFFSQFQVIFYGLVLFGASNLASDKINGVFEEVKYLVGEKLNQNLGTNFEISKQAEVQKIFQKVKDELGHNNIDSPDFQKKLYSEIKAYEDITGIKLIQSLILGFLYGFAYLKTIRRVKDEYMKIDVKSFSTFSLTSGGMVLVNGFVPGSIVYLESFLLAGYAVYLHIKNIVNDKNDNNILNETLNLNPIPTLRCDETGKPIVWNNILERETGYTHSEVLEYFERQGEIITLLYKGENSKKVKEYLEQIEKTGVGYKNIAFKITTKYGEEKTFLWTTFPDGQGGTIRIARYLTDKEEIQKELENTKKLLRTDILTGILN